MNITPDDREVPGPPPEERPFEPMLHNDDPASGGEEITITQPSGDPLAQYRRREVYRSLYITTRPQTIQLEMGQVRVSVSAPPLRAPVRIVHPPAHALRAVLELVMPRKAYERIIRPYFADEFHEYCEALQAHQNVRAHFIVARMYVMIWYNVAAAIVMTLIRPIKELTR